jgi:hypothetical protein
MGRVTFRSGFTDIGSSRWKFRWSLATDPLLPPEEYTRRQDPQKTHQAINDGDTSSPGSSLSSQVQDVVLPSYGYLRRFVALVPTGAVESVLTMKPWSADSLSNLYVHAVEPGPNFFIVGRGHGPTRLLCHEGQRQSVWVEPADRFESLSSVDD